MADKTLKSITFPGLSDRYVVPNNSADIEQIKEDLGALSDLDTTDKSSLVNAVNEAKGGAISVSAKEALIAILRAGLYSTDQSTAITEFAALIGIIEDDVTQSGPFIDIINIGSTVTQSGIFLSIA